MTTMRKSTPVRKKPSGVRKRISSPRSMSYAHHQKLAVIEFDANGMIHSWNPGVAHLTGMAEKKMIGKPFSTLWDHPEILPTSWPAILRQTRLGQVSESEGWLRHATYPSLWVHWILSPVNRTSSRFQMILHPIHPRLEHLDELKHFFTLSHELFCIADFKGHFNYLNPQWEVLLGYTINEMLSRPYMDFIHPEDRRSTSIAASQCAIGEDIVHFENRYLCRDGSYRWLSWSTTSDLSQGIIYATARDITSRKESEILLQQLHTQKNHQLEEIQFIKQELEAFSYTLSHDLRAPIRHIDGFTHALKKQIQDQMDPQIGEYVEIISRSCQHMDRMVEALLTLSRISRCPIRPQTLDMDVLVAALCHQIVKRYPDLNIRWKLQSYPKVVADPELIQLALDELLTNAVKYSDPELEIPIEIEAEVIDSEIKFDIRDWGIGVPEEYAARIWGPFQRLNHIKTDGVGMGLSIARRIIHRHGGKIQVRPTSEKGSVFTFTLPRSEV